MKKALVLLLMCVMVGFAFGGGTQEAAETEGGLEPLTFLFSSTFAESETGGQIISHFADILSENTGGKIKANVKYGGTLYPSSDEYEAVSSGAVQMIAFGHPPHADRVPLLCASPMFAPDSTQNALDYFSYIMFENEESAAVLQEEARANNTKYLNVIAGGANVFCSNFPFSDLDSLVKGSSSFGNMGMPVFEAVGFNMVQVPPPEMYNAFDRGIMDATQMGFAPLISMSLFEVADYWMLDNTYAAGNFFTVNLDWWNSLSAAQREAIETAAKEVMDYSAGIYEKEIAEHVQLLKDKGCTVVEMSDSDFDRWWDAIFAASVDSAMKAAQAKGLTEETKTVLKAAADFTDYDLSF